MKEIQLTQGKFALVDDEDYEYLNSFKWHYSSGYAKRVKRINGKQTFIRMHRVIINCQEGLDVDHINHNKLDNRKDNLRTATRQQNTSNKINKKHSSIYKGVHWNKHAKKWQSQIMVNFKHIHLGYFEKECEAAKVYNDNAIKYFGEYASLNEIIIGD